MRGAFYWALFLFFSFINLLKAQEFKNSITVFNEDGTIAYGASMLIDSEGFMWNATQEAVIKRIGEKSVYFPFEHPEHEKVGKVFLLEAVNGMIIGFSKFGCFTFNKKSGAFNWAYFYDDYFAPPIKDKNGNIWCITMRGNVSFCYTKEGSFLRFDHQKFLDSSNRKELNLRSLHPLNDGSLIAKSIQDKWYRISGDNVQLFADLTSETNGGKLSTFLVESGSLFAKNTSGIFHYKGGKYSYVYLTEIDRHLIYLPYDSSSTLHEITHYHSSSAKENDTSAILISGDIIELLKVTKNKMLTVKKAFPNLGVVNNNFLQRRADRLWISSSGTLIAIPLENHVQNYKLLNRSGDRIAHFNTRSIAKTANGDLYFLQNASGIFKLKKETNTFQEVPLKPLNSQSKMIGLYGFYQHNDSILIGYGWRPEIVKIHLKNNTFSEIKLPTTDINYAINDAQLFDENTLLLFGGSSILSVDLKTYTVKRLEDLEAHFGPSQNIHTAYIDQEKQLLWLGMYRDDGLYRIDLTSNTLIHFHTESKKMPLLSNNINAIYPDGDTILWIGTHNGLQKVDRQNLTTLDTYTNEDGLKNDHIVTITGNEQDLWFGTYNGLVVLHKEKGTFQTFSQDENFPDFEYNRKSVLNVNSDSLFFGGMNSLIKINPKEPLFQRKINKIFLTKITYYDNEQEKDVTTHLNLDKLNTINIPYKQNYLFLSFAINEIFDHSKVNYRYRIKGINNDWVSIGNTEELFLQGIESGDYELQIQGFNTSNEPTNILTYTLCIDRPFYMKISFYLLCAFVLISGFTTYIFYQKREFFRDRTLHELEAKSSQAQMLPHFTFNTINCIQSVMLTKGEMEANKVIVAYSKLLRHTLDVFHSDLISLKDELHYINAYLSVEKLRAHFTFFVNVDENIDPNKWLIPSMMFQPLVENAIKHGIIPKKDEGILQVSFRIANEVLIGEVIDNGIGIEASQKLKKQTKESYNSRATKILEERIYLFNKVYAKKIHFEIQDLHNNSGETGTKSILRIPLLTH